MCEIACGKRKMNQTIERERKKNNTSMKIIISMKIRLWVGFFFFSKDKNSLLENRKEQLTTEPS